MTRLATSFLALLLAIPIAAQQRISRIEVRGDVPSSIVISQSALTEGETYTESDLDAAAARVRRLPFVHDARYTVDGETLRIEVTGMTPVFGEVEAFAVKTRFGDTSASFIGGGGRHFIGSGVVEATVNAYVGDGEDLYRADLQFAQYGIGGTRLFAIAGTSLNLNDPDGFERDPEWQLAVGYPLSVRQTITASAFQTGYQATSEFPGLPRALESHSQTRTIQLLWDYDTTEDPYFARRGLRISAGPEWSKVESQFEAFTIPLPPAQPQIRTTRNEGERTAAIVEARAFRPFRTRSTFFAGLEASRGENDFEQRVNDDPVTTGSSDEDFVLLSAGVGHNFFDWSSPVTAGRHRIEAAFAAGRRREENLFGDRTEDEQSVSVGYSYRKRFATVRVNLLYGWE